jgi:hypothetical protein
LKRTVRHVQLHPNVAASVRRIASGWLIVVNPGLAPRARVTAEAQAHQYVDAFEMGWGYSPPAGGVDVCSEETFMALSSVTLPEPRDSRLAERMGLAVGVFAPLTALAYTMQAFLTMYGPAVGA